MEIAHLQVDLAVGKRRASQVQNSAQASIVLLRQLIVVAMGLVIMVVNAVVMDRAVPGRELSVAKA